MSTILKVQLNEEIRRISLDAPITLAGLESKIRGMFSTQLLDSQNFSIIAVQTSSSESKPIANERDLQEAFLMAVFSSPPILRLTILPGDDKPTLEPLISDSGLPESPVAVENETENPTVEVTCGITDDESTDEAHPTVTSTSSSLSIEDESAKSLYCTVCSRPACHKCLNCVSIYTCEQCIVPASSHNDAHLWIRLSQPISELPLKTQLLLISNLDNASDRINTRTERNRLRKAIRKENAQIKQERMLLKKKAQKERQQHRRRSGKTVPPPVLMEETSEEAKIIEQLNQLDVVCDEVFESVTALDRSLNQDSEESLVRQLEELEPVLATIEPITVRTFELLPEEDDFDGESEEEEEVLPLTMTSTEIDTSRYTIPGISFNEKLDSLEKMGFTDRRKNMFYLIKNLSSLERTVADLLG